MCQCRFSAKAQHVIMFADVGTLTVKTLHFYMFWISLEFNTPELHCIGPDTTSHVVVRGIGRTSFGETHKPQFVVEPF